LLTAISGSKRMLPLRAKKNMYGRITAVSSLMNLVQKRCWIAIGGAWEAVAGLVAGLVEGAWELDLERGGSVAGLAGFCGGGD